MTNNISELIKEASEGTGRIAHYADDAKAMDAYYNGVLHTVAVMTNNPTTVEGIEHALSRIEATADSDIEPIDMAWADGYQEALKDAALNVSQWLQARKRELLDGANHGAVISEVDRLSTVLPTKILGVPVV